MEEGASIAGNFLEVSGDESGDGSGGVPGDEGDRVAVGVLTKVFPSVLVDEVFAAAGVGEQRVLPRSCRHDCSCTTTSR